MDALFNAWAMKTGGLFSLPRKVCYFGSGFKNGIISYNDVGNAVDLYIVSTVLADDHKKIIPGITKSYVVVVKKACLLANAFVDHIYSFFKFIL